MGRSISTVVRSFLVFAIVSLTQGCTNPSITESDALLAARNAIETHMSSADNQRGLDGPARRQYQKITKLSSNSVEVEACQKSGGETVCEVSWRAYKMDETFTQMRTKLAFKKVEGGWALSPALNNK